MDPWGLGLRGFAEEHRALTCRHVEEARVALLGRALGV